MKRRKGTMLMELVMTFSAGSALVLIAVGTVHQTMRMSSTARDRSNTDRSLARLATQFRKDVQLATSMKIESPETLELSLASSATVFYFAKSDRMIRESRRNISNRSETEHEDFRLAPNTRATFESESDSKFAALKVFQDSIVKDVSPRIDLHVVTGLGRLLALENNGLVQP